ncbi:hypothetical protein DIPPA_26806 [Diplonema papillatum]|nr:hypothetical protein DIPPA_26806 [Diplonema papillatum]
MISRIARRALVRNVGVRHNSSEPPKQPEQLEDAYAKTHPFYDPFYSQAIFEFEFEEGFIDSSAFIPPTEREPAPKEQ